MAGVHHLTSREYQRAASQRLDTAEFLSEHRYNLDATYYAGYVIECSLKALILASSSDPESLAQERRFRTHDVEGLNALLKETETPIPLEMVEKLRQSGWSPDLRYETGRRDTGRTRWLLKTAKQVYDWVEGQLP